MRRTHSVELTAIVVDRVEALDGLFARWLPASMLALAAPALVAFAALLADPVAALVLVAAGLLVPLGMALAGIGAAAASRRQFLALGRLQVRFVDRIRGIATIVLAGRAEDEARALAAAAGELRRRTMRVLRVAFLSSATLDLAAAGALVALALHYGAALLEGRMTSPAMALFALLLVPEFFAPLRSFATAYQDRLHAVGAAEALAALPEAPEPAPALPVRTVAARGVTVAFDDVRLVWDPARGPALDGLTFRVPAGETLVLVGPSGAGKSTVIEILLGFVRPDSGRVTINGADIRDLVPQALSRMTAWIGQRPVLFAGTIRENIRFARPEATDAEVEEAARNAQVSDFAASLPRGLETCIGEGGYGLSGGQAQRVAMARAFLKNAPLLLLDEPTAHLDPATEAEVLAKSASSDLGPDGDPGQPLHRCPRFRGQADRPPRRTGDAGAEAPHDGRAMRELLRILGLWRREAVWLALGLAASLAALGAGVGLMVVSGATLAAAVLTGALAAPALLRFLGVGAGGVALPGASADARGDVPGLGGPPALVLPASLGHRRGWAWVPARGRCSRATGRRCGCAGRGLSPVAGAACRSVGAVSGRSFCSSAGAIRCWPWRWARCSPSARSCFPGGWRAAPKPPASGWRMLPPDYGWPRSIR